MASKRVRGLVPQRPLVRIVLLLAVVGMASGIAGAVFTGGETTARDPVAREASPPPAGVGETAGTATAAPDAPGTTETAAVEPVAPASSGDEPAPDTATTGTDAPAGAIETITPTPSGDSETAEPAGGTTPSAGTTPGTTPSDDAETAATAAPPPDPAAAEPPEAEPGGAAAAQLIERLRPLVAQPDLNVPDYDRDHFAGWVDSDGDCVNTRHEILQEEAVDFSMNAGGCAVASGEWFDPYTDRTFTDPSDLDVDHVVALADAWVSGAWAWADEVLDRFSNDLGNLNAIAAGENRSKSARGPADYSPTAPTARCDYLVQYATVKIRWELSITPQDFDVLAAGLRDCDVGVVPDSSPTPQDRPTTTTTTSPPPPTTTGTQRGGNCHPAYEPCLANLPGDALNCGDLRSDQKPVTVVVPGDDPYRLDRDGDGRGCTS